MQKILLILIALLVLGACKFNRPTEMDEGVIHYKIEYPQEVQEKGFADFLPSKMITTFKDKNYKVTIKGDLSLYNLEYISKANGDSATTLFRIFDKRMFHPHDKGEHLFLFQKVDETKVEYITEEIRDIAGFQCKKAIVHFQDSDLPSITVFYTEEIKFNRPKENSPFDDIPGALMEFQIIFKDLTLKCTAHKVDIKHVNDKAFDIPNNYTQTERGEIDELVATLIQ